VAPAADLPPFPDRLRRGAGAVILASRHDRQGARAAFQGSVIANWQSRDILIGRLRPMSHKIGLENQCLLYIVAFLTVQNAAKREVAQTECRQVFISIRIIICDFT